MAGKMRCALVIIDKWLQRWPDNTERMNEATTSDSRIAAVFREFCLPLLLCEGEFEANVKVA